MASKTTTKADQNSKIVRQISQVQHNKNCFDCGQKGPTYVNETIAFFSRCIAFLCRRGLNPAQRVKSISMGTFTDDEVKFIQLRGNSFCKNVWLWKYDPQIGPRPPEVRDDQKMKDFLITKYEKKRWYNAASELHIADQLKQSDSVGARSLGEDVSLSRKASATSQRSFRNIDSHSRASASPNIGSPVIDHRSSSSGNISLPRSHTASAVNHFPENTEVSHTASSGAEDLFSVFSSVSVSSVAPMASANNTSSPFGLDNWASFGRSQTMQSLQVPNQPAIPVVNHPPLPARPVQTAFVPLQPAPAGSTVKSKPPTSAPTSIPTSSSDKYAALAELDEIMHASKPTSVPSEGIHTAWSGVAGSPLNPPNLRAPQPSLWGAPAATFAAQPVTGNMQQNSWTDVFQTQPVENVVGFDANGAWSQYAYQSNGATSTTNPFLVAGTAAVNHPVGQAQPRPSMHPTNPFL